MPQHISGSLVETTRLLAGIMKEEVGVSALKEAQILISHVLKCDKAYLLLNPELTIDPANINKLKNLAEERSQGKPLAKVIGMKEFWSLPFKVSEDTLDPRPDTETLIETVLSFLKDPNKPYHILDLGTGTGCILLSLLTELPQAQGTGLDSSEAALNIAKENADNLNLSSRIEWRLNNWCEGLEKKYDIVVSNPPYIPEEDYQSLEKGVRLYEPRSALVSGPTGLEDYEKIISQVDKCLAKDGIFAIEIGINQEQSVPQLLTRHGFTILEIRKDLAGIPRCILAGK